MGGRSGSTSQANQTTQTSLNDSRVTNRDGVVVGDGSAVDMSQAFTSNETTNLSSWDASTSSTNTNTGSFNNSVDSVITGQAFEYAKGVDATLGAGLSSVLTFAKDIANKSNDNATSLASRFSDGVAQAFDSARNTTPGGIDNKTMIVIAVAGAAALAAIASKRG